MFFLSYADFFIITFSKNCFRVSNRLNPDQDRQQSLSADDTEELGIWEQGFMIKGEQ